MLQPLFTDSSDTAANKPATIVVACLPNFAAYINDDGQGRTAAFVSLDIMLTGSAPKGKFEQLASDSHFHTVQTCSGQTAKI